MKNIFEALREDHIKQRNLAEKLLETSGDSEERKRIYLDLKHELVIHANAEERYFYNPLIKDSLTQEKSRHGIAEHHEMDELVEKLDKTDMSSPAWIGIAKKLCHEVNHHLEEEEQEIFQLAGKVFNETDKIDLAKKYQKYIQENR